MKIVPALAGIAFAFICVMPPSPAAEPKIEEKVVGPAPGNPPNYLVSPGGSSVASLVMKGTRSVVVVDGVEGPLFDEFISAAGGASFNSSEGFLFSRDGRSHAYAARVSDNYIVVRDGRELFRSPIANRPFQGVTGQLRMSPGGKHVYFMDMVEPAPGQHAWRLIVDGKAGPLSSNNNSFAVTFSPDDSRWVYTAAKFGGKRDERMTVVDGKEVSNGGHVNRFTADNKLVSLVPAADGALTLTIDGKAVAKGVHNPEKIWFAPVGSRFATVVRKSPGKIALVVDGREVPEADGSREVVDVVFSPDGKRYMAICQTVAAHLVITDGKKGTEYRGISSPTFTQDSSRALYVISAGNKSFVVADGEESAPFEGIGGQYVKLAMPKKGARFAYTTYNGMNREFSFVVDGKAITLNNRAPVADTLAFSENGERHAVVATAIGRSDISALIVDGEEAPGMFPLPMNLGESHRSNRFGYFVFSPDGKHMANFGTRGKDTGLYVDGKLVYTASSAVMRPAFTPDGKHFFWVTHAPGRTLRDYALFVDGRKAMDLPSHPFEPAGNHWEMTPEGAYQFLAIDGPAIKRYRVTPPEDTNLETMIAGAEASRAEAVAAAEAAKKKAADEATALAARQKADQEAAAAKAKADAEAYAAKRKADAEAKTAARVEALAARKKAAADAAAAKAAARQKK